MNVMMDHTVSTETVRLPKEAIHGRNADSMGGSHHKSTASQHGSEDGTHQHAYHMDHQLPDHHILYNLNNKFRYKGASLDSLDIQRISDILIQKCKDTISDSDIFKNHNLNGDRVFKDVNQYLQVMAEQSAPAEKSITVGGNAAGGHKVQKVIANLTNARIAMARGSVAQ